MAIEPGGPRGVWAGKTARVVETNLSTKRPIPASPPVSKTHMETGTSRSAWRAVLWAVPIVTALCLGGTLLLNSVKVTP